MVSILCVIFRHFSKCFSRWYRQPFIGFIFGDVSVTFNTKWPFIKVIQLCIDSQWLVENWLSCNEMLTPHRVHRWKLKLMGWQIITGPERFRHKLYIYIYIYIYMPKFWNFIYYLCHKQTFCKIIFYLWKFFN
jgi:hypothetical protein